MTTWKNVRTGSRDGLKLVKLKNVKDKAAMQMNFQNGVLEMDALRVRAAHRRHVR